MWASALPDMWNNSMMSTLSSFIRTIVSYRHIVLLGVLLACTPIGFVAQAQDENNTEQQEQRQAAEADAQAAEQEQEETEERTPSVGGNSPDTFVPSEGISEDLSVSFPVDI